MDRRVVITGVSVLSPIGIGKEEFWKNLIDGTVGTSEIESFDTSEYRCHNGGEVKDFSLDDYQNIPGIKKMGKCSQFAVIASEMALEDAQLDLSNVDKAKVGVSLGTTEGEVQSIQEIHNSVYLKDMTSRISELSRQYPCCQANANVARTYALTGDNIMIPNACAAGNFAIGYAYDLIRSSRMDYMIAGGVEVFSRIAFTGFNRLFAVAPDKVQPFDKERKGMMVGEGAGIVILESLESALSRGATIYAEVIGYGVSCDAYHITSPHPEGKGILLAMEKALKSARVHEDEIDYVSLHGTGTNANDKAESLAIKKFFGDRSNAMPTSSIKSMMGHTMGAASGIETVACSLVVQNNIIPPTANYVTPDPECDINCTPNEAKEKVVNVAMNNSYAFGGNNTCLVIKKYSDE